MLLLSTEYSSSPQGAPALPNTKEASACRQKQGLQTKSSHNSSKAGRCQADHYTPARGITQTAFICGSCCRAGVIIVWSLWIASATAPSAHRLTVKRCPADCRRPQSPGLHAASPLPPHICHRCCVSPHSTKHHRLQSKDIL